MLSWERCDANEVQVQEDFSSWTQVCPPLSLFTWDIDRDRGENGFTSMRVTSLVPFRIFESSLHHYYYHCYVSSGFLPSLLMSHDHAENKCLAFSFNWGINQNNDAADDDELAEAWMGMMGINGLYSTWYPHLVLISIWCFITWSLTERVKVSLDSIWSPDSKLLDIKHAISWLCSC